MRRDVGNLLGLLNRKDLDYRQFADPFADMELWPIFEALLTDERVVGARVQAPASPQVRLRGRGPEQDRATPAEAPRKSGLFRNYAPSGATAGQAGEIVNMRQFLATLGDRA